MTTNTTGEHYSEDSLLGLEKDELKREFSKGFVERRVTD